jgi:vacuolar-type H+-ATPase subunit E/Vma4
MISADWVASVFEKFSKILKDADERRTERLKRKGTEDFDEEELEALEEENEAEEALFDEVRT